MHFTLLLVLFGAAAAKAQHTPLLTATLLSELPSVFYLLGKLQARPCLPAGSLPALTGVAPWRHPGGWTGSAARGGGTVVLCWHWPGS